MSSDLDLFEMPPEIPGAAELVARYGSRHAFHDGELESITLSSTRSSELRIRTWLMTFEVDDRGFYVLSKKAVVSFRMVDVRAWELGGFCLHNSLGSLRVERSPVGYRLVMESNEGVDGYIDAASISIIIVPTDPAS